MAVDMSFDSESKAFKAARKALKHAVNSGVRGADGLTNNGRRLLAHLKAHGLAVIERREFPRFVVREDAA